MTVTHTLVSGPRVVLTSRPAKTLSDGASIRIVGVLGRLRGGRKLAVIIIARRDKMTGRASGVVRVGSKLVRQVRRGVSRGTSPFNGGKFVGWLARVVSLVRRVFKAVGHGGLHAFLANFTMT